MCCLSVCFLAYYFVIVRLFVGFPYCNTVTLLFVCLCLIVCVSACLLVCSFVSLFAVVVVCGLFVCSFDCLFTVALAVLSTVIHSRLMCCA